MILNKEELLEILEEYESNAFNRHVQICDNVILNIDVPRSPVIYNLDYEHSYLIIYKVITTNDVSYLDLITYIIKYKYEY